jgi:hypothetical protein
VPIFIPFWRTTDFSPAATLCGIRLPVRLRVDERIQFHAFIEYSRDGRIRRQLAPRVNYSGVKLEMNFQ